VRHNFPDRGSAGRGPVVSNRRNDGMVKLRTVILTSVATLSAASAFAACEYPDEIAVPDGSQASMDEMLAAQQSVKSYMANMEDYLKCLDDESATLGDAETEAEND
jgi:hypothetical protein